ncbi:hypothetical protein D3C84_1289950 [compost metagenome]
MPPKSQDFLKTDEASPSQALLLPFLLSIVSSAHLPAVKNTFVQRYASVVHFRSGKKDFSDKELGKGPFAV